MLNTQNIYNTIGTWSKLANFTVINMQLIYLMEK